MAHIDITRTHGMGLKGARDAAEEVAAELGDSLGARPVWDGDTLLLKKSGVKGRLEAGPETVRVAVTLPLAMRPLRRTLQREVERYLDRYLGPSDGR